MIQLLKKAFQRLFNGFTHYRWEGFKYNLEHIYTDMQGYRWYRFKNPAEMPHTRFIAAQLALSHAEMKLTESVLISKLNDIKDALNTNNVASIGWIIGDIENRMKYAAERVTLTNLACALFLREGERVKEMTAHNLESKLELFKKDIGAEDFFLQSALLYLGNLPSILETDIVGYLKEVDMELEKLNRTYQRLHQHS